MHCYKLSWNWEQKVKRKHILVTRCWRSREKKVWSHAYSSFVKKASVQVIGLLQAWVHRELAVWPYMLTTRSENCIDMAQDYKLHPGLLQAANDDVSTSWYGYKLRKNIRIYQAGWCQFICCLLLTSTVITFVIHRKSTGIRKLSSARCLVTSYAQLVW